MSYTNSEKANDIMKSIVKEFPEFSRDNDYEKYMKMISSIATGIETVNQNKITYENL